MPRGNKKVDVGGNSEKKKAPKSKKQQSFSKGVFITQYFHSNESGNTLAAARGYMVKVDESILTGNSIVETYFTISRVFKTDSSLSINVERGFKETTNGEEDGLKYIQDLAKAGPTALAVDGLTSNYENFYYSFPEDEEIAETLIKGAFADLIKQEENEDGEETMTERNIRKLVFNLSWLANQNNAKDEKKEEWNKKAKKYLQKILEKDNEIYGPHLKEDETLGEIQRKKLEQEQEERTKHRAASLFVILSQLVYDSNPKSDLFVIPKEEIDDKYFGLKTAIMRILFYHN